MPSLAKNYLMSPLLHMIFKFFLKLCVTLSAAMHYFGIPQHHEGYQLVITMLETIRRKVMVRIHDRKDKGR
jgi:hypothetical protein